MRNKRKQPLHERVREKLIKDFQDLPYYSPLPGERELSELCKTSRPTLRKALGELEEEGLIITLHGKGSFYLGNRIFTYRDDLSGVNFYKNVESLGKFTNSIEISKKVEDAHGEIAKILEVELGEPIFHLERLRFIGDEIYSLTDSYLSYYLFPTLLDYDYTERSLHATIEEQGTHILTGKRILEIKPASSYEAMHLELNEGDPLSVMRTISYDEKGIVVEYAITKSSAYKTRYEMEVHN